ncbi:MAG: exopolyphosphatase [Pseudomonadota bacterium]
MPETRERPRSGAARESARAPTPARRGRAASGPPGASVRIGVVDVGSNSVRLVVFEALSRSPAYFFNEKVLAGLGAELSATGRLSPKGRERALAALSRFVALAEHMEVDVLDGVATAAVREAEDGPDFVREVERVTGIRLRIASGEDEARLSAQGVLMGWPDADGLVADLGGASLELARVGLGQVSRGASLPLGPLRLRALSGGAEAQDAEIAAGLARAAPVMGPAGGRLYLVGGSWRALAKIHMTRIDHPIQVLHEFELPADDMLRVAEEISLAEPDELAREAALSRGRLAVTPLGARVLAGLIRAARPAHVAISAFGLREGVLYEHLPEALRAQDPLISAAREMERRLARFPGFGAELAAWVWPLFPAAGRARRRLIEAACLLNDVSWNAHPDYRDEAVFETVYRANLSGVGHAERAWIGAALRYRYKAGKVRRDDVAALTLLSETEREEARLLGRAIRLGSMLCGSSPGVLPDTALEVEPERLVLRLPACAQALAGEMVRKRLSAVAQSVGRKPALEIGA